MKIITLTEVGSLDVNWFWNCDNSLTTKHPFHSFLSFVPFDEIRIVRINSDLIEEFREGFPVTHVKEETYVKRHRFIEFFFGKKHKFDFKTKTSKDKVTWIKMTSGKTLYVKESIDQIKDMLEGK